MKRARVAVVVSLLAAFASMPACGPESLSEDSVTSIPPGNARGRAFDGPRAVTWLTTDCDGNCYPVKLTETQLYTLCDRGFRQTTTATFTQEDGRLFLDVPDSTFVSNLRGGVNADGAFDVGGVKTEVSGTFTMRARVDGVLQATGGRARVRVVTTPRTPRDAGTLGTNCTSTHELTFGPAAGGPAASAAPPAGAPDGG